MTPATPVNPTQVAGPVVAGPVPISSILRAVFDGLWLYLWRY